MKSTFDRMTKKRKFRRLRMLIMHLKVLAKRLVFNLKSLVFKWLFSMKLVNKHEVHYHGFVYGRYPDTPTKHKDIVNDRGTFKTSCVVRVYRDNDEIWYISRRTGKKLFTVIDIFREVFNVEWRAEPHIFVIKVNPWTSYTITKDMHVVQFLIPPKILPYNAPIGDIEKPTVEFKIVRLNFLNARFKHQQTFTTELGDINAIEYSWDNLKEFIDHNSAEINKRITGIEHDGNLVSSQGYTLTSDMLCPMCGAPVFETYLKDTPYFCIHHDLIQTALQETDKDRVSIRVEFFKSDLLAYCDRLI